MAVTVVGSSSGAAVTVGGSGSVNLALLGSVADAIDKSLAAGGYVNAAGSVIPSAPGTGNDAVGVSIAGTITVPSGYKTLLYNGTDGILTIQAAAGLDVLSGTGGITYYGAADPDGAGGVASVVADGGRNLVAFNIGSNYVAALGAGADTVYANGNGLVDVGGGTNLAFASGGSNTVFASGASDTIVAGTGAVTVGSSGAKATIFTGSGASFVAAAGVGDTIVAGSGLTTIFGGDQGVVFFNNSAFPIFVAPASGAATVVGGVNPGIVFGSPNADVTYFNTPGGAGGVLVAGSGSETLNASGTTIGNTMYSGTGRDLMLGGAADDVIVGATGSGTLTGGGGRDLFTFIKGAAGGTYVISDFVGGTDAVVLSGYGTAEVTNVLAGAATVGGSTSVALSDGTTVMFTNVGALTTDAFRVNGTPS